MFNLDSCATILSQVELEHEVKLGVEITEWEGACRQAKSMNSENDRQLWNVFFSSVCFMLASRTAGVVKNSRYSKATSALSTNNL